jgi:hypothetical protein
MKVITQTILTAEAGCYLTNCETYGKTVVLPQGEAAENWYEITEQAYAEKMEEAV